MNGNKTLLTVAGVLAIVCGIFWCITIIGIIFGIPLIIGGAKFLSYAKMNSQELLNYKSSILGWSIFFILFTLIAGILVLIFYLDNNNYSQTSNDTSNSKPSFTDQIKELDKLKQDGLITEEDYEKKKKKILDIEE